jgi:hypothetical protein
MSTKDNCEMNNLRSLPMEELTAIEGGMTPGPTLDLLRCRRPIHPRPPIRPVPPWWPWGHFPWPPRVYPMNAQ